MKSKAIISVIAIVIALFYASCGKKGAESSSKGDSSAAETTAESIVTDAEESSDSAPEGSSEPAAEEPSETDKQQTPESVSENSANTDKKKYGRTVDINDYISTKEIDPPLWKVTDPISGNSIYLLGTLHFLPSGVSEYPSDLIDIYNSCDSIAVEYDITAMQSDLGAQLAYAKGMIYSDGTNIKDHISEESYNKAKDYLTSIGAYSKMLDLYTAGYWINQLTNVEIQRLENIDLTGTDMYFITKAKENGKEIINIEELSMQTDALNAYSDDYADYTISEMVDSIDDIDGFAKAYGDMFDMWAKGSDDVLTATETDAEVIEFPQDLYDDYEAYTKTVFYDRNQYMAGKASEYIKEGKNCLFMVGSAHYSGEYGVDDLLAQMGYSVEKIS